MKQRGCSGFNGFAGPFFPNGTEKLSADYQKLAPDNRMIASMGKMMSGYFLAEDLPQSTDDHAWYSMLWFKFDDGIVAVAFPHKGDDCSIAFYVKGHGESRINTVLLELSQHFSQLVAA